MLSRTLSRVLLPLAALVLLSAAGCGGAESRKAKHLEKGQSYLAAGNLEKARVEFQNALQIAPKDAEARFEMGVIDEKLQNARQAAQYYQAVLEVDPDHVGARTKLARLYLFSSMPDKALDLIQPALEKHPDNAELLSLRSAVRVQQKDPAGALADAERAVQLAPANEDAVAILAGIYAAAGDKAKAQGLLERAIQKIPDTVELRLILAQIDVQAGQHAEAEALLLKLVELKPAEKSHRLRLAQFYALANQIDAAEHVLRQAVKDLPGERDLKLSLVDFLVARRGHEAAESELKAMIAAAPSDNELKFALARFYEGNHDLAKAEAVYRDVIEREKLDPAGLSARNHLADLRLQNHDVAGALALAQEVLAKSPRDDEALLLRGNIALAQQDPRSAIADLRAVLRDQPNAVGVLRSLARAHLANGEPAVAEETMRHALETNPKDPAVQLDFAQLLAQMGKAEQAKPVLADLVKQQPDNVAALDAQFRVSIATKDLVTAKSAAAAIVAIRPKSALGYFYQGVIAEAENRPEEAVQRYSAALDLEPEGREPLQAEVRLLMGLKRTDQALKRLDGIAAANPGNVFALNLKGDVLLAGGRTADAQAAYRAAIERAPKWWVPYRGLAYAQIGAKDVNAAIDTLRKAQPVVDQADALGLQLASLLESQGRADEAVGEYEEILRRYPKSEVAMNNYAMLLVTHKTDHASLDRAKALASRFAESANPSYLDTYGWVLYKRGESAASVPVLERVVAKVPNEPLARYHLGMALSQSGASAEAVDNLTRAVNSGTKFSGLDEAKATLEKLAKLPAQASATPRS
ncbi:MAG TPA: tetratricopeptide repeat protein [Steroidobacteraceae bacterium]|jgi:tetratricopeptide (TPR) repeat protein